LRVTLYTRHFRTLSPAAASVHCAVCGSGLISRGVCLSVCPMVVLQSCNCNAPLVGNPTTLNGDYQKLRTFSGHADSVSKFAHNSGYRTIICHFYAPHCNMVASLA